MSDDATPTPAGNRHFLQTMTPSERSGIFACYDLAGRRWSGYQYQTFDSLSLHRDDDFLEVVAAHQPAGAFRWNWSRKLANEVHARHSGLAETPEAACQAALDYAPTALTFHYQGESSWLETSPAQWWVAAIDGGEAVIHARCDGQFAWSRDWPSAKSILALVPGGYCLGGVKPTLEEAMQACIDAPALFKRACAALVMAVTK